MKDLLTWIVSSMVSEEGAVEVDESVTDEARTLRLRVAQRDRGAIIGRQGRTIRALEAVLQAAATDDRRTVLEVLD